MILIHQQPNHNKCVCVAVGLGERKHTCACFNWQESIFPLHFCIMYHWCTCNVHVGKLSNVLVRSQKVGLLWLLRQYLHLKLSFVISHYLCGLIFTAANLSSTYTTTFPVQIWCESYLTAAARDCEGGIAAHTFSRSVSRVFFMHSRSSLQLMGAVRQALSRIMTCKWVEIVNSISNERRQRDMMRWVKSFVTTEWCSLIPRGNYEWNAL